MFEIPGAKRVRRDQLGDSSDDDAPTPKTPGSDSEFSRLKAEIRDQVLLDLPIDECPAHHDAARDAPLDDHEEFEFRLFSHAGPEKKVVLKGDNEISESEGHMVRQRPRSYYIADPPSQEEQRRIRHSALSGDDVLKRSRRPNWGMQMPWRVIHISVSPTRNLSSASISVGSMEKKTKKRPGKKSRIALRKRMRTRQEKAALEEKKRLEKEEQFKEKKKRLNRMKKLRKRAKKKAEREGEEDHDRADSGGSSSSE